MSAGIFLYAICRFYNRILLPYQALTRIPILKTVYKKAPLFSQMSKTQSCPLFFQFGPYHSTVRHILIVLIHSAHSRTSSAFCSALGSADTQPCPGAYSPIQSPACFLLYVKDETASLVRTLYIRSFRLNRSRLRMKTNRQNKGSQSELSHAPRQLSQSRR